MHASSYRLQRSLRLEMTRDDDKMNNMRHNSSRTQIARDIDNPPFRMCRDRIRIIAPDG